MGAVLLAALALAGGLWWMADGRGLDPPACLADQVGVWGPIKFGFIEPMQRKMVEERIQILPNVVGRWDWQGNDLVFYPRGQLNPTQNADAGYTIQLKSGAQNLKGKPLLEDLNCRVSVRKADIVYQAVGQQQVSLVEVGLDGSGQIALAQFNTPILSFVPSRNGAFLAVSVQNRYEGSDLWIVDRNKKTQTLLVDCKQDHCENPAWAPDGQEVAYDRMVIDPLGPLTHLPPQVWRSHLFPLENGPLIAGNNGSGQFPQYSPDGQKLAYFDRENEGIRIINLTGPGHQLVKSNSPYFAWSPDSGNLLYFSDVVEMENHYMNTYIYRVGSHQSDLLLNEYKGQFEFGRPTWSADGNWITMAARLTQGGLSKQLLMLNVDGSEVKNITDTQLFTHSSYHWSPDGERLVYQRLELGSSEVKPQIFWWNRTTGETKLVVDGGSMPDWLP